MRLTIEEKISKILLPEVLFIMYSLVLTWTAIWGATYVSRFATVAFFGVLIGSSKRLSYAALGVVVCLMFALFVYVAHGIDSAVFYFNSCLCIFCVGCFVEGRRFNPKIAILYLVILVMPVTLYSLMRCPSTISILPSRNYGNIFGGGTTKHGTATAGMLLFSIAYLAYERTQKKKIYKVLCWLGVYFLLISKARGHIIGFLVFLLALYINKRKVRPLLMLVVFVSALVVVYGVDAVVYSVSNVFVFPDWAQELLRTDGMDKNVGVSSGRDWLWSYHMGLWGKDFIYGQGKDAVYFVVGVWLPDAGVIAPAGGESYFTQLLAGFGMFGAVLVVYYLWLMINAMINNNKFGVSLAAMLLITTATGANMYNAYMYQTVLFSAIYFWSYDDHNDLSLV